MRPLFLLLALAGFARANAQDYYHQTFTESLDYGVFSLEASDNGVALEWETEPQSSARRFIVEHSVDGVDFAAVYDVPAETASDEFYLYRYTDTGLPSGRHFYRLRMIDLYGNHALSDAAIVYVRVPAVLRLFPSPAVSRLNVVFDEPWNEQRYEVYDMGGRLRLTGRVPAGSEQLDIDVSMLNAGSYMFRVISPSGVVATAFVKA